MRDTGFLITWGLLCVISGFHVEVDENCALLGYDAASSGNTLPTFRDNLLVPSSRVKSKSLEDGTDRLSRSVGKELSLLAAW